MSILHDLPAQVATRIKTILPGLAQCSAIAGRYDLARLKQDAVRTPAVLVSLIDVRQTSGAAGPVHHFGATMAAYVITRDSLGLSRDEAAANICAALSGYVPDKRWGQPDCGEAQDLRAQVLITTQTDKAGASLWAVTWTQPCVLTSSDAAEPIDLTLYVGQAPEIGADHLADYEQVTP